MNSKGYWNGIEHTCVSASTDIGTKSIYACRDTTKLGSVHRLKLILQLQSDSGANRNVTNEKSFLQQYRTIKLYSISGINENPSADISCIGYGFMPLTSTRRNNNIMIKVLHCPNCSGTIVSPTAIITQFIDHYQGWNISTNCDTGLGTLRLLYHNGVQLDEFPLQKHNDLWYHSGFSPTSDVLSSPPKINLLSNAASFELWHQRLAHPGQNTMQIVHQHVLGVPKLRGNAFYKCPSCMSAKMSKRPIGKPQLGKHPTTKSTPVPVTPIPTFLGQHWHMDFGFMRGTAYMTKDDSGKTITSVDGYNSYLLIIERKSRFIWIFLSGSKIPPIHAAESVLENFKSTHKHQTVRTDQGGKLGQSSDFRNLISKCGFSLKITGSDASAQNGLAENPNKSLAMMVRCLLYSSEMSPQFWSFALIQATYIKNRLPHATIGSSPYEVLNLICHIYVFSDLLYTVGNQDIDQLS